MQVSQLPPRSTLQEQVLNRLRDAIIDGVFEPESQINQAQLAAEFGVSRGPLREAIRQLETEGLVRSVKYRGTFVTPLDREMVRDLYNVRAELEAYATRLAVENCVDEDLTEIRCLIEQMRKAALANDAGGVVANDFAVHTYIVKLSRNMFLEQIWSTLQVQVRRVLSQRHRGYHDLEEIADSHVALLKLFRQKDAVAAGEFISAHIRDAGRDLLDRWDGEPKWGR